MKGQFPYLVSMMTFNVKPHFNFPRSLARFQSVVPHVSAQRIVVGTTTAVVIVSVAKQSTGKNSLLAGKKGIETR